MKMFVLLVTLSLASTALGSLLCPHYFSSQVTVHIGHPTDCGKFLTCVGSHPVVQDCPAGLYWNEQNSYCDYAASSRCSRALPEGHAKFNTSNLSGSVCLPPETNRCPLNPKPDQGVVFLKHRNCRKFYACVSAQPVELSCPLNLYWNSRSCTCDYVVEEECEQFGMRPEVEEEATEEPEEPTVASEDPNAIGPESDLDGSQQKPDVLEIDPVYDQEAPPESDLGGLVRLRRAAEVANNTAAEGTSSAPAPKPTTAKPAPGPSSGAEGLRAVAAFAVTFTTLVLSVL